MKQIEIVDVGRGLQLSTSRVRVQDLVPYFQEGCNDSEIMRWIPTLSREEIAVAESYYRAHKVELGAEDRRIRQRNAQRKNADWIERIAAEARTERLSKLENLRQTETSGEAQRKDFSPTSIFKGKLTIWFC